MIYRSDRQHHHRRHQQQQHGLRQESGAGVGHRPRSVAAGVTPAAAAPVHQVLRQNCEDQVEGCFVNHLQLTLLPSVV